MASDDENEPHAIGIPIPAGMLHALTHDHETARARSEDRYNGAMRWLDSLDVEGLMALRWVLASDAAEAYANNRFYDGMVTQSLRAKGVDPDTGMDPTAQLLESATEK